MKHEMVVHLTDDEYSALAVEAKQNGQELADLIQDLLEDVIARRLQSSVKSSTPRTTEELSRYFYASGLTEHIPSHEPLSAEEEAELERLGKLFSQGKPF